LIDGGRARASALTYEDNGFRMASNAVTLKAGETLALQ
jgi:hypothetical protein